MFRNLFHYDILLIILESIRYFKIRVCCNMELLFPIYLSWIFILLQFINLNTYQYVTKMARKHILLIQTIDITRK